MVSKTPKSTNFTEATAQIGTDSNYRATIDSNRRLDEKAAFRLNVMGNKGDAPGRDDAVDFKRWGVAPSLTLLAHADAHHAQLLPLSRRQHARLCHPV